MTVEVLLPYNFTKRYIYKDKTHYIKINGFEMESNIKLCIISLLVSLETCSIS